MAERGQVLVRVTKKDLRIDRFRAGGKGGSNQNKRDTGVRITHIASGAVGEARDERSQTQNQRLAFRRMAESEKFRGWLKVQSAMAEEGYRSLDAKVDDMMREENLRVEFYDPGE